MLEFTPADPFPLPQGASYAEAQAHARTVDEWLGMNTEPIEARLAEAGSPTDQQLWIGLPTQSLLTPYTEIRELLERLSLKPDETVVDLGAGYGRMSFVIARHFPGVRFVGYEYVRERVEEANRALAKFGASPIEVVDLKDPAFFPIEADYYFLYDYGTRDAIEKTLQDLRVIAQSRAITVIGRGRASRDAIERWHPWLSGVVAPEHFAHYSIYRTR